MSARERERGREKDSGEVMLGKDLCPVKLYIKNYIIKPRAHQQLGLYLLSGPICFPARLKWSFSF